MKGKLSKLLVGLLALAGVFFVYLNNDFNFDLFAAGLINNTPNGGVANSLHAGDEVHLGKASDDIYTTLGQSGGYLYLLKKNTVGSATNYNTALSNANAYKSEANFGKVGNAHLSSSGNGVSLISRSELNAISGLVSSNQIASSVSNKLNDVEWWLKDANTSTNRANFAKRGNLAANSGIVKRTVSGNINSATGGTCGTTSTNETGVKPISSYNDSASPTQNKHFLTSKKVRITCSMASGNMKVRRHGNASCTNALDAGTADMTYSGTIGTWDFDYTNSGSSERWSRGNAGISAGAVIYGGGFRPRNVGDSGSLTIPAGGCAIQAGNFTGGSVDGATNGDCVAIKNKSTAAKTINCRVNSVSNETYSNSNCPVLTNNAGTALVRPYVKIKASDVIMRNNAKRTYAQAAVLNTSAVPRSDNAGQFLTLQTSTLSVGLNGGASGVSGNTYTVVKPSTGTTISLPVYFGTSNLAEGSRYVSAEATDINNQTVYSVLGSVGTGNTANVNIDFANLLKPDTNTFKVTLYLEDSGAGNTTYRSNGTEITVKLMEPQYIRFDTNNAGTVKYGDQLTVKAELYDYTTNASGDIKQSGSDLTFAIASTDTSKAYIDHQTYNPITGKAEAVIAPLTGTGTFTLTISKSGDDQFYDAEVKSVSIQLTKKDLTLVPSDPPGITVAVGDLMPSLEPVALITNPGDGLVGSDSVPVELYPTLERMDVALAEHPAVSGVVTNGGDWKMFFPDPTALVSPNVSQFLNKYDVTFVDYDDDNDYIFTADPNGILEQWIEISSPLPPVNGWYRADVTLKPSNEAKYFGYWDIALVEDGVDGAFGSTAILTDDTTGFHPTVKLKKQDEADGTPGEISSPKTLLTKIKIDQTKPTANINVPSGWASLKKTVNLQAIDPTSGIDTTNADSVQVYFVDNTGTENPITLTNNGNGAYEFDATANGLYKFVIKDRAGNVLETFKNIQQIDTTPASITATLGALSADGDIHDIDVARVEPDSGINYMQVWFQGDGDVAYHLVGYLNRTLATQTYQAQMNGRYEFRMKIGSGEELTAGVYVTDITQIKPVVGMNAINMGDNSAYIDDTWVNQDVKITLSNLNTNYTEPVSFQYRLISDHDWNDMSDTYLDITTTTWMNEFYEFRAVGADGTESNPVSITVKIDKEKPQPPVMNHPEQLDDDYYFIDQAEISGSLIEKPSGIGQYWEYSLDGLTWNPVVNDKFEILGAGDYEIQVRTKDEAGNESDIDTYPVHIKGKPTQTIAFDHIPASVTYGTCEIFSAKLTSDIDEQANTALLFAVGAGSEDKIEITTQSYDPDTGIATATVCPKNGDVFFDIEIRKAGDDQAYAAVTQSETIALHKKALLVHPQIIYGKNVGDVMPTLISVGNALVNGDTIPSQLSIVLTPDTGTSDPLPTDTGNPLITHAGTWTMTYPANILTSSDLADFVKKYDITLEDYNTNTDYVFTTTLNGIPDAWIIVTPDPNGAGWNKDNVKIELSDDAHAAGWQTITLIENGAESLHGADIELSNETNGMTPIVVLKKADGETSGYKSLRYVKLDKTNPNAAITIDHESDWTSSDKKVTITLSDTSISGVSSGIKDVIVSDAGGNPITLTQDNANTYSFMADNGTYHFSVSDQADNVFETDITVAKIDKTAPTISAVLGALSADASRHDIDVEASVGTSGVQSFSVYYKENVGDPYPAAPSESLNPNNLTLSYPAYKNGWYKFEIINNAQEKASAEVEINDVIAAFPIVAIQAELDDGSHTPYVGGTWVNQDVIITLSNINPAVSETITYQYKKSSDDTWTDIVGDKVTIEESSWQNETYEFRGVITTGEGGTSTINVCIDKEKPQIPSITDANLFDEDHAFAAPLTITGSVTPKDSGIGQVIMVSQDHGITWNEMSANTLTLTTPNTYSLTFKTVDEAGNESDEYTLEHVNVNDGTPRIDIKLNHNLLKDIAHHMTFGYLFKERVDVDIEVEWYGMADGDIYYILDDSETASVPAADDPRWTSGDHTSIDPDRKTMIYAKAVNSEGKTAIVSSIYYVTADQTPPEINFDKTYEHWISDDTLTANISDNLSGVSGESIEVKADVSGGIIEPTISANSLQLSKLPDGEYKVQVKASDNSGNAAEETIMVKIDTKAPEVNGVKDQSVYHQYYLPRFITVNDVHSGVVEATISKDGGSIEHIDGEIKVKDIGTYELYVRDNAGNEETIHFAIVALPDITTEIDCSEASREIIEQIEAEYEEDKDLMDETERDNIRKWIADARDIWNTCRIKIVYNEDHSAWVEGLGDVDFAPDVVMVIEEISESSLPKLPGKAKASYDVYLKRGDEIIEPSGRVKVHLPYEIEDEKASLYEIDESDQVKKISYTKDGQYFVFEVASLEKYAITGDDPSVNIDWDCDGTPDLNIDTDDDGKADINIDTNGDGKPDYNVDTDGDGKADMNIGPIKWDPNKCFTTSCGKPYCTSSYYKPFLNIDSDDDGRPDINVDLNKDGIADINIDLDEDMIPDIEIDSDGDGKADINLDTTGNGRADTNLVILTKWEPNHNVDSPIKYDTMSGIKVDKTLTPNKWMTSDEYRKSLLNGNDANAVGGANTGDYTKAFFLWILFIISSVIAILSGRCKKKLNEE